MRRPAPAALAGLALLHLAAPAAGQEGGAGLARELGCAGCHAGVGDAGLIRERAPALGRAGPPLEADFIFQWLADPGRRRDDIGTSRMPDFRLDEGERLALALFLAASGRDAGAVAQARRRHPGVDADLGGRIWGALGCAGCHGSPEAGRAPPAGPGVGPDLSREGARVRTEWLRSWLADPSPIRSPAHPTAPGARMPDFRLSAAEADALTAWLGGRGRSRSAAPAALSPHQRERTERLLEDRAACLGCHVVNGRGGGIGPSLEGAAQRLRPEFVAEMVVDPTSAAPGAPMPRQRMPEREARRLARLVLDAGAERWQPTPTRSLADPEHPAWAILGERAGTATPDGADLYARHCAACHGTEGRGDGWNAPALPVPPAVHADPEAMGRRPDDTLYDGIHGGAWVLDGSARMAPYGDLLRPDEIRALVAYIRRLCSCSQPAWAADGGSPGEGS